MKALFLPILLAFFVLFTPENLIAQPTLTAANTNVQVGEQFIMRSLPYFAFDFFSQPKTGPNQVWNFSQYSGNTLDTVKVLSRLQPPFPSQAQGASKVLFSNKLNLNSNVQFRFLENNGVRIQEKAITRNSFQSPTISEYSNPVDLMRFPFTFNSSYLDTSSYSYIGQNNINCIVGMFYRVEAVGFGTIITPAAAFNHALLVKTTKENLPGPCNGSYQGFTTLTYYDWYVPGIHFPVVRLVRDEVSLGYSETGYYLQSIHLGETEETLSYINLKLFPNPVTSAVTIQYSLKSASEVHLVLTDALDREVIKLPKEKQPAGNKTQTLDISKLPKGVYLVRLETAEGTAVKRLLIQ